MVQKMIMKFAVEGTGNTINYEQVFVDSLFNIPVVDKHGKVLGRAILTQNLENSDNGNGLKEKIILLDIIVYDPENRGKGIGDQLMGFLTTSGAFQQIVTGWNTEAGRELCLKWGFKYRGFGKDKYLIWENENGKDNERQEGRNGIIQI